jgi:large subunit ribosomal protein L29
MKSIELRELTLEELRNREEELTEELARLRIQLSIKRLDNPLQARNVRRDLARVKTIIHEKVAGAAIREAPQRG